MDSFFGSEKERKQAAVIINQQVSKQVGFISMFQGRPVRPEGRAGYINGDDITNLTIALNTCLTLELFFAEV